MVIEPGDLVIGDDDGLLCVPFDQTASVYADAKKKNEAEATALAGTMSGKLDPKAWVDETLRRLGCEGL
jgi:regulator of RNase E activity RraA